MLKLKVNQHTVVLGKLTKMGAIVTVSDKLATHPMVAGLIRKGVLTLVKEEPVAVAPVVVEIPVVVASEPEVVVVEAPAPAPVEEIAEVVEAPVSEPVELVVEKPKSRRKRKE